MIAPIGDWSPFKRCGAEIVLRWPKKAARQLTACRQKKAPRRAEAEAEKSRGPHWVERKNPDSVSARRKTRSKRIQLGVNRLGRDMERNHITANNEPMTAATGAKVA